MSRSTKESGSSVTGASAGASVVPFVVGSSSLTLLSFPSNKTSTGRSRRRRHYDVSRTDTVRHSRGSLEGLNQVSDDFYSVSFIAELAVNADLWVDDFHTEKVLKIYISIQKIKPTLFVRVN